jgi:hypothetical protein
MLRLAARGSVVVALLLAGGWLMGDDTKKGEEPQLRVKGTLPANYKKLGLTEQQVQDIYKVQAKYDAKIAALRQQIRDLQEEQRMEREKLLTGAQKARLRELRLGETRPKEKTSEAPVEKVGKKP